ncbi:uncharacterized protein LOC108673836 [Hyalella azteca]|uniref:Uncharacterized protein LOC108673836 n=1 Tax=Hyalella azteca TaxID=294128 RepID=A0A8B7NTZ5_HYAAZ|nr:uncharacterized protein LOC108673836 [Hyalella azteca]
MDWETGFQPCDDVLESLLDPRPRIKGFKGCIRTFSGITTLAQIASAAEYLHIHVEAPLDLRPLPRKCRYLRIYVPLMSTTMVAVPLPDLPSPHLTVLGVAAGSAEAVAQTVLAYAPSSKWYSDIALHYPELSEEEERRLLTLLHIQ